jgi:hypothetical protein
MQFALASQVQVSPPYTLFSYTHILCPCLFVRAEVLHSYKKQTKFILMLLNINEI